jgi:hypothetical protein
MQRKQTSECNYKFLAFLVYAMPPPASSSTLGGMRHIDIVVADDR